MHNIKYKISTYPAKNKGYQSKNKTNGIILAYISNIWRLAEKSSMKFEDDSFQLFVDFLNYIFIHERFCLERAFQKIRIKGDMCNPCCVRPLSENTVKYLYNIEFEK